MLSADLFRDRRSQLAKVVLLLCGCYFALAFAGQAWKARGLAETLAAEKAVLAQQELEKAKLQERLDYLSGPGYDVYVERTAREKLGMAKKGDVALFVVPDSSAPSRRISMPLPAIAPATRTEPQPQLPVWKQWIEVFFP